MTRDPDSERLVTQLVALDAGETLTGGGDAEQVVELHARLVSLALELSTLRDAAPQPLEPATRNVIDRIQRLVEDATWNPSAQDTSPSQLHHALSRPPVEQLGQYRLGPRLGAGGMGAVYKARHLRLERDVALKLLPVEQLHDPLVRARFEREMKAVGQLKHPNIVAAADAGEADGIPYLVMELVDGEDLGAIVARWGQLPVPLACGVIQQAAIGLQHAWQRGLVHRDIKPANLMLSREGDQAVIKILDLGLALLQDAPGMDRANLTSDGQVMGTIEYMAPEQATDTHNVGAAADVYSLGSTLFKLLSGQSPLAAAGRTTVLAKLRALADEDLAAQILPSTRLPNELRQLLERMLARDTRQRPVSPGEIAAALAPFATGANLGCLFGEPSVAVALEPAQGIPHQSRPFKADDQADLQRSTLPRGPVFVWSTLATIGVLLAVFVFRLVTDTGTIEIRSFDPALRVTVKKSGKPVKTFQVSQADQHIRYAAGDYEIVLADAEGDDVEILNNVFSLSRNGVQRVEIIRLPDTPARPGLLSAEARWIDLLATFDPSKSTMDGAFPQNAEHWFSTPEGLKFIGETAGVARFPVVLRDRSYRIELEFTRQTGNRAFNLDLPMSTGLYTVAIAEGDSPPRTGLSRSKQATRDFQIQSARRYRLAVTVQTGAEGRVELEVDGRSLLVASGDPLQAVIPRDTSLEQFHYLGIYVPAANMDILFHAVRVQYLD